MAITLVMPSNHPILCRPFSSRLQSFPASGSFPMSQLSHQLAKGLQLQHQSFQWVTVRSSSSFCVQGLGSPLPFGPQ